MLRHLDQRGTAEDRAVEWRGNFRAARRARQRTEHRPAPDARNRTPVVSACHSISLGFDLVPVGRPAFDFPALTYFSERSSARIPYLTLFPIGNRMRANSCSPIASSTIPGCGEFAGARRDIERLLPGLAADHRRVRGRRRRQDPAGRYVCQLDGHRQPGIVLVGRRLCDHLPGHGNRHRQGVHRRRAALQRPYPAWLATDGMDEHKIAAFYDDPVKTACDAWSAAKAHHFRSLTIDNGLYWRAQRWARSSPGCRGRLVRCRTVSVGRCRDSWRRCRRAGARNAANPDPDIGAASCRSILIVLVIVIIVAGLIGRVVRLVALVVPQLAIDAVGGEQLLVRTALDRLAA